MSGRASRTIYVGNFPGDIREWEVEDLFYKYGPIVDIDLKVPPRPPGYCFIEFKDAQDAEDGRDGYSFDGHRLRVELAHVGRGLPSLGDCYSSYSGGGSGGHGSVSGSGHGGVSKRSEFRVIVNGLPSSASWQDLKDHMRRAGDVCFAQVFRDGNGTTGIVDYSNYEDMKYAVRWIHSSIDLSESLMTLNSEIRLLGPIYGSKVMRLIEASQEAIAETSLEAGAGAGQGAGAKAEAEVYQETEVKVLSAAEAGASVEAGAKDPGQGPGAGHLQTQLGTFTGATAFHHLLHLREDLIRVHLLLQVVIKAIAKQ